MGKLNIVDKANFILEGEFEKFKMPAKATLDEQSVINAVGKYKLEIVDKGFAVGELSEGFLTIDTGYGDQIAEQVKDPAFMIVDIWWDTEKRGIWGKVIVLDSADGMKIKSALGQGIECYMSSSETDTYHAKEENTSRVLFRISEIKNFKVSLMNFHSTI